MSAVVVLLCCVATGFVSGVVGRNDRPVIGILSHGTHNVTINKMGDTMVCATYIRFVESAGARAVVIRDMQDDAYYDKMFSRINGLVLPGGAVSKLTSGYAIAAHKLLKKAIKANEAGDYFPVWGVCLGLGVLSTHIEGTENMELCDSKNQQLPLQLVPGYSTSKLFRHMPKHILETLRKQPVTPNYHITCLKPQFMRSNPLLNDFYQLLSINTDSKGEQFVSTLEAKNYPFYGLQWHPEKILSTWRQDYSVDHSPRAVEMAQYLANFFVNEARQSEHHFETEEELSPHLFSHYKPWFSGPPDYKEYYLFNHSRRAPAKGSDPVRKRPRITTQAWRPIPVPADIDLRPGYVRYNWPPMDEPEQRPPTLCYVILLACCLSGGLVITLSLLQRVCFRGTGVGYTKLSI